MRAHHRANSLRIRLAGGVGVLALVVLVLGVTRPLPHVAVTGDVCICGSPE